MYIPANPPTPVRHLLKKRIFGQLESVRRVIFTPMRAIYDVARTTGDLKEVQPRGWWPTCYENGLVLTLTPTGGHILDGISALEPGIDFSLLGVAGALRTLALGDIVEIGQATINNHTYARSHSSKPLFPAVSNVCVSSIVESLIRSKELATIADCVDMETGCVFATAKKQQFHARSIQVIVDHCINRPVYLTELNDYASAIGSMVTAVLPG